MVAFLDTFPTLGHYIARMLVVPSVAIGAQLFLARVEADVGDLSAITDETSYATALYVSGYYTGTNDPATPLADRKAKAALGALDDADQANIAAYVNLIQHAEPQALAGLQGAGAENADPTAITVGPPFASLEERLTPSPGYAPHTIAKARALLKGNADSPPPGGISLGDALAAGGDGVWLFGPNPQPPAPRPAVASSGGGSSLAGLALLAALGVAIGVGGSMMGARL